MAANYTPNFHLSQWEANDPVKRIDFNANNLKIDTALTCHPSAELICSKAAEDGSSSILELDISQVDWNRYFMVLLLLQSSTNDGFQVTMNGSMERTAYVSSGTNSIAGSETLASFHAANHMTMLLPVLYNGTRLPTVLSFGSGGINAGNNKSLGFLGGGGGQTPLNRCNKIVVSRYSAVLFASGDCAALWGVK